MKIGSLAVRFASAILRFIYQFFIGKYIERKYIMPMYGKAHADYKSRIAVDNIGLVHIKTWKCPFEYQPDFVRTNQK